MKFLKELEWCIRCKLENDAKRDHSNLSVKEFDDLVDYELEILARKVYEFFRDKDSILYDYERKRHLRNAAPIHRR